MTNSATIQSEKSVPIHHTEGESMCVIEAVLFAAGHPVTYNALAAVLDMSSHEIKTTVDKMAARYSDPENSHGIMLIKFEDSCQLCTRAEFSPAIRQVLGIHRGGNLSASSLEVLAVVAYNQPVTRSYIDTVRGVDSGYVISSLADKGLIEQKGRLDVPGRPILYGTTPDFLRCFGISSTAQLPHVSPANNPHTPEEPVQERINV